MRRTNLVGGRGKGTTGLYGRETRHAVRDWPVSDTMSMWMGYPSHDAGHQEKEHVTRKPHNLGL